MQVAGGGCNGVLTGRSVPFEPVGGRCQGERIDRLGESGLGKEEVGGDQEREVRINRDWRGEDRIGE